MNVIILGDLHFPYHSKKALDKVLKVIKQERPDVVVQIGDLFDQYSFSRFTRKNLELPQRELEDARNYAEEMWDEIARPGRKCLQILGNHDLRLIKRAEEKLPEAQDLIKESILELYEFKGVKTVKDDRDITVINGVSYHHGYLSQLGAHRDTFMTNVVVGHSHTGGVSFRQINGDTLWELNVGYLADQNAEPLRYSPSKSSKWTLGYGLIDSKGPRFTPL